MTSAQTCTLKKHFAFSTVHNVKISSSFLLFVFTVLRRMQQYAGTVTDLFNHIVIIPLIIIAFKHTHLK